ncbi:MAG: hypothetical protein JHC87_05495, partial [Thermoleophilaceae bacterium]|nr:hypothetical protein [Thermoleophilaceae bacterium]
MHNTKCVGLFIVVLCASASLSACGTGKSSPSGTAAPLVAPAIDPSVAALVPAHMENGGTIVVAMDPGYPPDEYLGEDGHTIIGLDVDIANALGS